MKKNLILTVLLIILLFNCQRRKIYHLDDFLSENKNPKHITLHGKIKKLNNNLLLYQHKYFSFKFPSYLGFTDDRISNHQTESKIYLYIQKFDHFIDNDHKRRSEHEIKVLKSGKIPFNYYGAKLLKLSDNNYGYYYISLKDADSFRYNVDFIFPVDNILYILSLDCLSISQEIAESSNQKYFEISKEGGRREGFWYLYTFLNNKEEMFIDEIINGRDIGITQELYNIFLDIIKSFKWEDMEK